MTEIQRPSPGQKALLVFVSVGLMVMLAISLWERITNPALEVVSRAAPTGTAGGMGQAGGMDPTVAKLMEQLRDKPNDLDTLIHLTEHMISDQNWAAAETFVHRAVVAAPGKARPLYLQGLVQHNLGRHKEAAESLEKVIALEDEASVRYSLGVLYIYYLQDVPKGVAQLSAGLNDPKAPEALKKSLREELEKAPLPNQNSAPAAKP